MHRIKKIFTYPGDFCWFFGKQLPKFARQSLNLVTYGQLGSGPKAQSGTMAVLAPLRPSVRTKHRVLGRLCCRCDISSFETEIEI